MYCHWFLEMCNCVHDNLPGGLASSASFPQDHLPWQGSLPDYRGLQPQVSLPGAITWGGGGPGSVLLNSTLLAKSTLGGEEGSGGRRSQTLLLTNAIQVYISLNSALGSLSDSHHLSRSLQTLFGAAGVCQALEKIGSSPSSFSLLLVVSERPEPDGKIYVFIEMLLLCRGVVFLSLGFLKKQN